MSSATLMILGDSLDPQAVTKLLGMRPSQQWRCGERKSFKHPDGTLALFDSVYEWGGWKKWSSEKEQKKELPELVEHWCRKLALKKRALAKIRASGSKRVVIKVKGSGRE